MLEPSHVACFVFLVRTDCFHNAFSMDQSVKNHVDIAEVALAMHKRWQSKVMFFVTGETELY